MRTGNNTFTRSTGFESRVISTPMIAPSTLPDDCLNSTEQMVSSCFLALAYTFKSMPRSAATTRDTATTLIVFQSTPPARGATSNAFNHQGRRPVSIHSYSH